MLYYFYPVSYEINGYKISDLDINGKILKDLGYKGKEIGEKLNFLLDEVIKNPLLNKKDILINLLKL